MNSSAPELAPRTIEVELADLEPDIPSAPERSQASPARALFMRVIVGAILCGCVAIMILAAKRFGQRHDTHVDAPAPSIAASPTSEAQPPTVATTAPPEAPAVMPTGAAPTAAAPTAATNTAVRRVSTPSKQVKAPASQPRQPSRTVRASH
jgi:hypothetical protein